MSRDVPVPLRDSALVDERDRRGGSIHKRGDCLDLNQLIVIAQHSDAHQGAGHVVVAERVTNNRPRRTQVRLTRRSNQDAGADHVFDRRASRPKRLRQRLNALGGLPRVVTHSRCSPVLLQRARAREENQARSALNGRRIRVLGNITERSWTDKTNGGTHPAILSDTFSNTP